MGGSANETRPKCCWRIRSLQSFADLLKFVLKEVIILSKADKAVFLLAPFVTTVFAISAWAVIPFDAGIVFIDINIGIVHPCNFIIGCLWDNHGGMGI